MYLTENLIFAFLSLLTCGYAQSYFPSTPLILNATDIYVIAWLVKGKPIYALWEIRCGLSFVLHYVYCGWGCGVMMAMGFGATTLTCSDAYM